MIWKAAITSVTTKAMRLAIASGKGGTGKTTLAVNLASFLAQENETLLVDLDVEEPNSGIFIQGQPTLDQDVARKVPQWEQSLCTLCGKCPTWCKFNALLRLGDTILVLPELCHSCYACSELCPTSALPMQDMPLGAFRGIKAGKLSFLESRLEIGVEQASPLIDKTLRYVDEHHKAVDYQILDCPPGTSCSMVSATKTAEFAILVTEPTPFGLHDLTLAVETLRILKIPFAVVLNRSGDHDHDVEDYCARESIPLWAKIPDQRRIAHLYSQGKLLYEDVPEVLAALKTIKTNLEALS